MNRNRINATLTAVALAALLAAPAAARAYETIDVANGGKITGTITLQGKLPATPKAKFPANLNKQDRDFCKKKRPLVTDFYRVGKGKQLADVAVWLRKVKKGKARKKEMGKLANLNCRFLPLVQTIDVGAKLLVTNDDPINHTTHPIYERGSITAFNIAMPKKGQRAKKKVRRAGLMKVQCDAGHVWMRAWVHAFKHPYHTVSGADGAFTIDGIPPGDYTLEAWHEKAGKQTRKIKITAGGAVTLDLTFNANK